MKGNTVMNFTETLNAWAPRALSVLRVVAALLFLEHGAQKLLGFPASSFTPAMGSLPWIAGLLELVGGILLILGLFTRPVAFVLAGQMAVAYWLVHAPMSAFPANNGGDAAILFCGFFLYLVFAGGGAWSLDDLLAQEKTGKKTAEGGATGRLAAAR